MNDRTRANSRAPASAERPEPVAVLEDLDAVRDRAITAERERDAYRKLAQQTQADFENYQKRNQRDLALERRYAHAPLARELLPVLDNLQRALDVAGQLNEHGSLMQGVALAQSQLLDILRRFGVSSIDSQGKHFDPALHEAVGQQQGSVGVPGTVLTVAEPGYRIHERILRPAKVIVAAPDSAEEKEPE